MPTLRSISFASPLFLLSFLGVQMAFSLTPIASGAAIQVVETKSMPACTVAQCGPAPMVKTTLCKDGSTAGRGYCERQVNGKCGWTVRSSCHVTSTPSAASKPTIEPKPNCAATIRCMAGTRPICRSGKGQCIATMPPVSSSSVASKPVCLINMMCIKGMKAVCGTNGKATCVKA